MLQRYYEQKPELLLFITTTTFQRRVHERLSSQPVFSLFMTHAQWLSQLSRASSSRSLSPSRCEFNNALLSCKTKGQGRIAGFQKAAFHVNDFITEQVPPSRLNPQGFLSQTAGAKQAAWQLGNLYLFIALMGYFVLGKIKERNLIHAYLLCLAVADVGHIGSCYLGMGSDRFFDVSSWNVMAWGNIVVTGSLFLCRIATIWGLFDGASPSGPKTKIR